MIRMRDEDACGTFALLALDQEEGLFVGTGDGVFALLWYRLLAWPVSESGRLRQGQTTREAPQRANVADSLPAQPVLPTLGRRCFRGCFVVPSGCAVASPGSAPGRNLRRTGVAEFEVSL